MLKYIISVLSVCLVISSCVPCESDSGSGGSISSSSSSSSSGGGQLECPPQIKECIVPSVGVFEMAGTPCNADHDCARWSPCVDARCDFEKPQSDGLVDFPGSCDIKLQIEPVYCGEGYICNPQGNCCPEN